MTAFGNLIRDNRWFFYAFLVYTLTGGVLLILFPSGEIVRLVNGYHTKGADWFFSWATTLGEELPYIFFTLALFIRKPRLGLLIPITGILVTLLSFGAKTYFAHPRPATFFKQQGTLDLIQAVEGITLHTGFSSFPSGHTFSAFALYSLLAFLSPSKVKAGLVFFLMAFLVAFSRIYLVQHFLKDVYLGALLGVGLAMVVFIYQSRKTENQGVWYNRPIRFFR